MAPAESADAWSAPAGVTVVSGGRSRSDSVQRGLAAVSSAASFVLVHDAARPLVPAKVVTGVVAALRSGAPAVIPVLPVVDTVKQIDDDHRVTATVAREQLRRVQTPQGFQVEVLRAAYAAAPDAVLSDDAGVVEARGVPVLTVAGDEEAFKITTPHDLRIAELLAAGR